LLFVRFIIKFWLPVIKRIQQQVRWVYVEIIHTSRLVCLYKYWCVTFGFVWKIWLWF